jgi:hypothetical protein
MNRPKGKVQPEELVGEVIDFLSTKEAVKVFQADITSLSKMRSYDPEGHRYSPFERVGNIIKEIRIQIEDGTPERAEKGREVLDMIGKYFAQLCQGKFISNRLANDLTEVLL